MVAPIAAATAKRKRKSYDSVLIERAVSLGRQVGAEAASLTINRGRDVSDFLPASTIRQWMTRWRSEKNFWENPGKRGRPDIFTAVPAAAAEWERQVDSFRAAGESVTGRVSATVLRAVFSEKAPSLLAEHGGSSKMSISTGTRALAQAGKSFRKRTTTRILPPSSDIAAARDFFYQNIIEAFPNQVVDMELLLNFDQTFQLFNPARGYTWEKKGSDRVQLAASKDGFTLCPVVSSVGVVGAQLIFSNKIFPSVAPGAHLLYTHTPNHWSNEATMVQLWQNMILPHIAARRATLGDPNAPAIVLADAFAAHWTPAVKNLIASENAIAYIAIPDTLTHLFQPLDLGIIAALKQSVLRRKDEFVEGEVRVAIRENRGVVLSKSKPVLRTNITIYIKEALLDPLICAEHCCRSGFDRAGVTKILYGEHARQPDVDGIVPARACNECGEPAPVPLDLPRCACFTDSPDIILCPGCHDNHNNLCECSDSS